MTISSPTAQQAAANYGTDQVEIQMLGDLVLSYQGKTLSGSQVRAKRVWALLQYLLANRHNEISAERQMDALWPDEDVEDPANALKNLVYRLRNILKNSLGLPASDYILHHHGAYFWNTALPCKIDADLFEAAATAARSSESGSEAQLKQLRQAAAYYKGSYLPQAAYQEWAMGQSVYYENLYMECIAELCQHLLAQDNFQEAQAYSRQAIMLNPFVEKNHELLLRALIANNDQKLALEHYNTLCRLFYDELGVRPSETIEQLYQEVIERNNAFEKSLSLIKTDLNEASNQQGALLCNYDIFKQFYRLEARSALRSGKSIFVALLTVTPQDAQLQPAEKAWLQLMGQVESSIANCLRRDDVVTRYNRTQFLLMLANITQENTNLVLNRVVQTMSKKAFSKKIEIYGQLASLDPYVKEVPTNDVGR